MALSPINRVLAKIPVVGSLRYFIRMRRGGGIPHGEAGVRQVGHRKYVGGMWDEIGRLQFDFLVGQGLEPRHYLLDIACGSLRAGVHLVPYLEEGHYLGVDKEKSLLDAGVEQELGRRLYEEKKPRLLVSDRFEFEKLGIKPDYAIAQSLFTHLPPDLIRRCLTQLRPVMDASGRFFATFFECPTPRDNPNEPHDHGNFYYTRGQMEAFGADSGWLATYFGDWRHPRNQVMMEYRPK